ncbi:MAG: glycosyltransferase family 4 protein [Desulforhopalus sp.]|nr:glycosyltransferase family 4 protein [Desulforhopalus sp.]
MVYLEDNVTPDVVFVVGGTKRLIWLWRLRNKGVPIVHRLDGMNWLHLKIQTSMKQWLLNETRNLLMQTIRSFFADAVIYQSKFVLDWWHRKGFFSRAMETVIHNGIDLDTFVPHARSPGAPVSLLCVEGNLDYSPYAIDLLNYLQDRLIEHSNYKSLILYGSFQDNRNRLRLSPQIDYRGVVTRSELPSVYKEAVYLSLDVNAACPNTVIEALACGIPVIGFDTGALRELVPSQAGAVVPYGSNPWNLDYPDFDALVVAAKRVLNGWERIAREARRVAEERYGLPYITQQYLSVINACYSLGRLK